MVPAHRGIELQTVFLFIVVVDANHLAGVQSISATESTARSTAAKSAVAGIVGVAEEEEAVVAIEISPHSSEAVAALVAHSEVDVGNHTLVHTLLHAEVEHGLLLSVVDARHLGQVALLIVGLDFVDDAGGQVLEGSLCIARHKFLAVNEYFLHLLTVNLDGTVVAHLCTRQSLHKFFHHRPFRCAVGGRVVDEGVLLERHFLCHSRHHGPLQHDGVSPNDHVAHG